MQRRSALLLGGRVPVGMREGRTSGEWGVSRIAMVWMRSDRRGQTAEVYFNIPNTANTAPGFMIDKLAASKESRERFIERR